MVTNNKAAAYRPDRTEKPFIEGVCLSTDDKPTDVANGSSLMEMDTGKVYMYDEEGEQWRAFA